MISITKKSLRELANNDWDQTLITINFRKIDYLSRVAETAINFPNFSYLVKPCWELKQQVAFWIYCSALAFQFWELDIDGGLKKYCYGNMTGSTAMFRCLRDNWIDGELPLSDVSYVLSNSPNSNMRIEIAIELSSEKKKLYEIAEILIARATRGQVSVSDASLLVDAFPKSFSDPYLKKAQLALTAIASLVYESMGVPVNCDLTALADYQVPRVLRALGIIEYSPKLATLVDNQIELEVNGCLERAIRAATIVSVENIANRFNRPEVIIDNILWQSQDLAKSTKFHLTQTTFY
ncbi:queuosine salvage family protein [Microbulbifer epialgicus]|uniref:Queuosine 5'-phosphate N-glycosylase/hydrolase n=1 Tax=Microbulbifer epialgicus TaxID=393907 RepID=A0ABV4NT95_9GAMM